MEWIKIGYLASKIGVLPTCGGLFDQEPRHINRLTTVLQMFDKYETDQVKNA